MKKLKAGIIGIGRQTIEDHIPGISDSEEAELVAICDINAKKLKEWSEKLKVTGYKNFEEMIDNEKLDFVIAATPHNVYKKIIESSAEKHVHVLKEKPFARNLEEALYFKRLSEESGIHIMTTMQRRFNPIYTSFLQLRDQIGKPFFIESKKTLFIEKPEEGWRGMKSVSGGGCILDMGYHLIDLLIWYFGLPDQVHAEFSTQARPEKVYDAEDTAAILFKYDSGLYGTMTFSRFFPPKIEYMKVLGSRGIIELERGKIKRMRSNGKIGESLIREQAWPAASTTQIDYFCKVIKGERENIGDPNYHLQHMAFIDSCYKSGKEKTIVSVKELLEKELLDYEKTLSN